MQVLGFADGITPNGLKWLRTDLWMMTWLGVMPPIMILILQGTEALDRPEYMFAGNFFNLL